MHIRPDQFRALASTLADESDHELSDYVRIRFPERFRRLPQTELMQFVRTHRTTANQLGVCRITDVATFLDLIVMYGDSFFEEDWAADLMLCSALTGQDKITGMRTRLQAVGISL